MATRTRETYDGQGNLLSTETIHIDDNVIIKQQIAALEAQQTPRRIRESLKDQTFLNNLDAQIAALRGQLK